MDRRRLVRLVILLFVGALALVSSRPVHAGTWTVSIPCRHPGSPSNAPDDHFGLYHQTNSNTISFTTSCTPDGEWNPHDPTAANWGHRIYRNGVRANVGATYYGALVFKAPGNVTPDDAQFDQPTRVVRLTYHRDAGRYRGSAYQRSDTSVYTVGLFATDFASGSPRNELVNGCPAGSTSDVASAWPGQAVSHCGSPYVFVDNDGQTIDVPRDRRVGLLQWLIRCEGAMSGCANDDPASKAQIWLSGLKVTVEDETAPTVVLRQGGLQSGATRVSGTQALAFDARDVMGLDRAQLLVDGKPITGVDWPCRNRDGQEGPSRTPCDKGREREYPGQSLTVDTSRFLNGRHAGLLRVFDALGNRRDVPFEFTTYNASVDRDRRVERRVEGFTASGAPTEIVAAGGRRGSKTSRSGVTVRRWRVGPSSSMRPRIRGLLRFATGKRRAIGRVKLAVFVRSTRGLYQRKRDIATDRRGRFSYRLTRGPSRAVSFVYRGGGRGRGAIGEVAAQVRARVTIGASRRSVVNRQFVTFSGRVRGGPIPARGVLVELQAFQRGRWRTFQQARARGPRGSWRSRYRFETVRGRRVSFRFRARVRSQSGYPYNTGTSKRIRVTVRGR